MSDPQPQPAEAIAHTVITHDANGVAHVQHLGAAHVVEGSVRVIDLMPGETVVIRHVGASE